LPEFVCRAFTKPTDTDIGRLRTDDIGHVDGRNKYLIAPDFKGFLYFLALAAYPYIDGGTAFTSHHIGYLLSTAVDACYQRVVNPDELIATKHPCFMGRAVRNNAGDQQSIVDIKIFDTNSIETAGKRFLHRFRVARRIVGRVRVETAKNLRNGNVLQGIQTHFIYVSFLN